jgi:TldD protein
LLTLLEDAVDRVGAHTDYAEARHVRVRLENVAVRNGVPDVETSDSEGIGVRVRRDGAWAFAAARGVDESAARDAAERAVTLLDGALPGGHPPAPEPAASGTHRSPAEIDPFAVSIEDKLALAAAAEAEMRGRTAIAVSLAGVGCRREEKSLVTSEGARCRQVLTESGGGIEAVAVDGGASQVRSYPGYHAGHFAQAGWEHVQGMDLVANAPRVADEAAALLTAPACPEGPTTLLLAGEQLAVQIHESVGHAVELDRVLGGEASYAGTSFVAPDDLGRLRYGSEAMSITADATLPGGLGSFGWDDEGVPAQAVPIVRDGVLAGFLSSRESAAAIGLPRSGGCMRADGFRRQPIVRMTNVSLDPGDAGTLDDLIASTDRGVLLETNRSWSIDSRRLHFQFGGEAAWEIVDGRLGRLLRDPVYAGVTPTFWAGLDAVCSEADWRLMSVLDCGKGEPGQIARVSHGCAPARFRDVAMGSR